MRHVSGKVTSSPLRPSPPSETQYTIGEAHSCPSDFSPGHLYNQIWMFSLASASANSETPANPKNGKGDSVHSRRYEEQGDHKPNRARSWSARLLWNKSWRWRRRRVRYKSWWPWRLVGWIYFDSGRRRQSLPTWSKGLELIHLKYTFSGQRPL